MLNFWRWIFSMIFNKLDGFLTNVFVIVSSSLVLYFNLIRMTVDWHQAIGAHRDLVCYLLERQMVMWTCGISWISKANLNIYYHLYILTIRTYLCKKMTSHHRNHLIDLLCKLIDWFLHDGNFGCDFNNN